MSGMSQEEISTSTKTVAQGLEALKQDHETIKTTLLRSSYSLSGNEQTIINGKSTIDDSSLDSIRLAIDEAHVMMALAQYLQQQEAEKLKRNVQIRRLCQENAWLRDELNTTQRSLQVQSEIRPSDTQNTLQDLGFGPKEEDLVNHPTPTNAMAASASAGYDIPQRLKTLHDLVIQYAAAGRYEVAVPLCKQALEDLEKNHGHDHPDVATMLNILGLIYRNQNNNEEVEHLLNEALAIREKCFGDEHPVVASTLNNLAVLHGKRGKFKDAEPLSKRALIIREKVLGSDHPDVAKQLNNLALLCQNQGKYDEVESYYRRSLEIFEAKLGPDDSTVAKTKNNLSSAYLKQGKYKEAEALYKEILSRAHEHAFGQITESNKPIWQIAEDRENLKGQYAGIYQENGDWQRIFKGENSQAVQTTMKNLSVLYRRQEKYLAAEVLEDANLRATKKVSCNSF
uniref:Kinesin light chain n=1 Tax=Panagrolaimus sp. ES5 TaxID=591445 RepID=A0AC34FDH5_9BILA